MSLTAARAVSLAGRSLGALCPSDTAVPQAVPGRPAAGVCSLCWSVPGSAAPCALHVGARGCPRAPAAPRSQPSREAPGQERLSAAGRAPTGAPGESLCPNVSRWVAVITRSALALGVLPDV